MVWALAVQLTGRRSVATIATILVCTAGGLGWIRLVGDVIAGGGDIVDLVGRTSYDNTWIDGWPFFKIASIFSTGFLPHRATTLGLPGLVTVVLLVVASLGRRPAGVLLAGILAALLAPFQFYAFPATYLIVGLYVVTSGAWRARTVGRDAILFLAPVVLATPFILGAVFRQNDIGAFRFVFGWAEAPFKDGPAAVAFFYLTNLGIPFVLAVVAAFTARGMPGRWFLVAWMVALFIVPNVVVVSAVEFDMNKYFQMMWIAVAILAAWLMHRWALRAIVLALFVCALSPMLIADWHMRSRDVALGLPQEAAARWIAANTPERSVFITDAFINSPVDLAGRLRITTFGPYVSNLGYDPRPREADTIAIYCDGPEIAAGSWRGTVPRTCCRAATTRARVQPGPTSPRATSSRRSTTRMGSRSGDWRGPKPGEGSARRQVPDVANARFERPYGIHRPEVIHALNSFALRDHHRRGHAVCGLWIIREPRPGRNVSLAVVVFSFRDSCLGDAGDGDARPHCSLDRKPFASAVISVDRAADPRIRPHDLRRERRAGLRPERRPLRRDPGSRGPGDPGAAGSRRTTSSGLADRDQEHDALRVAVPVDRRVGADRVRLEGPARVERRHARRPGCCDRCGWAASGRLAGHA